MTADHLPHLAAMPHAAGGVPAYGNRRSERDACFVPDEENPEHRWTTAGKENP